MLAGREHDHAAGLPDGERGPNVLAEVELLEGHRIWLVLLDQGRHGAVDARQAPLRGQPRRGLHDTSVEGDEPPVAARNDAVAGVGEPRVDAENDHGQ